MISGCFFSCDPACFEGEYEGADDALSRITITHTGGHSLPASEVYITGVAEEYPPEPRRGKNRSWAEVSDLGPTDSIEEDDSVNVTLGFVLQVLVFWRHAGGTEVLEEFDVSGL